MKKYLAMAASWLRYGRGAIDHLRFFGPSLGNFILNFGLSIAGVVAGVAALSKATGIGLNLGDTLITALTAVTIVQIIKAVLDVFFTLRYELRVETQDQGYQDRLIGAYGDDPAHRTIKWGDQALVYEPALSALLETASSPLHILPESYRLPSALSDLRMQLLLKVPGRQLDTFNGQKVRLVTSINSRTLNHDEPINVQRTDYYSDRLTNNIASKTVSYERLPIMPISDWNLDSIGRLLPLDQSVFSNQLGGSTLLLTKDRKIVYVRQGTRSDENRDRLAPAGSGSFDWSDIADCEGTFQARAKRAIFRELKEEVGLAAREADCLHHLVGFGRYLYRGGKPELFSIICTHLPFHSLIVRVAEWDFIDRQIMGHEISSNQTPDGIVGGMISFRIALEKSQKPVSGPLYFNCCLAIDALEAGLAKDVAAFFAAPPVVRA